MSAATATDATTRLVDALRARVKVKGAGRDRWRAQCPAHGGDDLNLAVAKGDQGVLVKCWSHDCSEAAIAEAVGMQLRDLFDRDGRALYDYGAGYQIERRRMPSESGNGKIVKPVRAGITPTVRPLWQPDGSAPIASSPVVMLCEGEKAADALLRLGASSVATWAGGTNGVDKADYRPLTGRTVVIVPDNDEPGQKALNKLVTLLDGIAADVKVWRAPAHLNDAADLWLEGGTLDDLIGTTEERGDVTDGSTVQDGSDGSYVRGPLGTVRDWLATYINVVDDLDLDLLALWAAHTHVAIETFTTPRLILDSTMPGSGKTTVLEHLQRFCLRPIQAASISSPALLARMLDKELRTILIDEVDRSLDPKKPGVEELIAILNSGYKRGATRPVLVPAKGGSWDVAEMSTYSPVAMAGNAPDLPDDTRSRSIRVLLMPDIYGVVQSSDWEEIEIDAADIGEALASALDRARDEIRAARPALPDGCVGRLKEKWNPLARVASIAGGRWPEVVTALIERDMKEIEMEKQEGLLKLPPAVILLRDIHSVWREEERFIPTSMLIGRLVAENADYWGEHSPYGKQLTAQRMGRLLVQGAKIHSAKNSDDVRGYSRDTFAKAWRQLGITLPSRPSEPSVTVEPSTDCRVCGAPLLAATSQESGVCGRRDDAHAAARAEAA